MGKRLCFICDEYPPALHGGIGTMTRDLAEGLVQKGFSVTVMGVYQPSMLRLDSESREWINGVEVIRFPASPEWLLPQARMFVDRIRLSLLLRREHREKHFQVVECPDYQGLLAFGAPPGVPLICRMNGSVAHFDSELGVRRGSRLIYFFERRLLSLADHLLSVSDYTARKTLALFSLEKQGYRVIHNAVDTSFFSPQEGTNPEPGLVVFVGSLVWRKGIAEFLSAMNLVLSRHPESKACVVGKAGEATMASLKGEIPSKWKDKFLFTGHLSRHEVLAILRRANMCVFPSKAEAFPIAPLEAMSVGKPVILTSATSGPEVVEDGRSGLLCDPYSPKDIADKICLLLENKALAHELGKNARRRVLDHFDRGKWLEQNAALFESIVGYR